VAKPKKPAAELRVYWSKRENALMFYGSKPTGGWLSGIFDRITMEEMEGTTCGPECKQKGLRGRIHRPDESDKRTFSQELEARGYDLTTLRFQIRKKQP
jgi:hypothetical protein